MEQAPSRDRGVIQKESGGDGVLADGRDRLREIRKGPWVRTSCLKVYSNSDSQGEDRKRSAGNKRGASGWMSVDGLQGCEPWMGLGTMR